MKTSIYYFLQVLLLKKYRQAIQRIFNQKFHVGSLQAIKEKWVQTMCFKKIFLTSDFIFSKQSQFLFLWRKWCIYLCYTITDIFYTHIYKTF